MRQRAALVKGGRNEAQLLCFEEPAVFCHRGLFAEWWETATQPMTRRGRVVARLAMLGGLSVVVALTLLGSYYVADHDRQHGGRTPDQGWEDVAIVALGAIVLLTPAVATALTIGRVPRGKLLVVAGIAGFAAVVAWWSWITTILD